MLNIPNVEDAFKVMEFIADSEKKLTALLGIQVNILIQTETNKNALYSKKIRFDIDGITKSLEKIFKLKSGDLVSANRHKDITEVRHIAMYVIRCKVPNNTLQAMAFYFNRDHSTVLYGIKTIEGQLKVDKSFQAKYSKILMDLKQVMI